MKSIEEFRDSNVDEVRVIQVVEVKSLFGDGIAGSPCRQITEYFSLDGVLLASVDSCKNWVKVADKPETEK
jgi:hypothetical protein